MQRYSHIIDNPPKYTPILGTISYMVILQQKITDSFTTTNSTLQYHLDIMKGNPRIFDLWKKYNIRLHDSKDTHKADSLYLKIAEPLNDLKFSIGKNKKITEIDNYDALLKKWKTQQQSILRSYTGDIAESLVQKMTERLLDYDTLKESLSRDLVLQHLLKTSLNDYLIYYGEHKEGVTYTGLTGAIPLPFQQKSILGLQGEQLHLQSIANLDKSKTDIKKIAAYFKEEIPDFDIQNLEATIQRDLQLDYHSIWIEKATITHIVYSTESSYRKEITLTIKKVNS